MLDDGKIAGIGFEGREIAATETVLSYLISGES